MSGIILVTATAQNCYFLVELKQGKFKRDEFVMLLDNQGL